MYQKNIKIYMAHAGMNQRQVANIAELSQNAFSAILTGKTDPKYSTLLKIAHALNKPLWELFIPESSKTEFDYSSNPKWIKTKT